MSKKVWAALMAAILLGVVFPVPVVTGFSIFLTLVLFELVGKEFSEGAAAVGKAGKMVVAIVSAIVVFVMLRILAGHVMGLPFFASYVELTKGGGISGFFWGRVMSIRLLWEILFGIVVGKFVADYAKEILGLPTPARWRQKLVAVVMVGSLLICTLKIKRPGAVERWRSRIEAFASAKISTATLAPASGVSASLSAAWLSNPLDNPPDGRPICGNAGGNIILLRFGAGGGGETDLPTSCWSAKFKVVPAEDFILRVDNPSMGGFKVLFVNGEEVVVIHDQAVEGKFGRFSFRMRGLNKPGHATVAIRPYT